MAKIAREAVSPPEGAKLSDSPPAEWAVIVPPGLEDLVARRVLRPPGKPWSKEDCIPPVLPGPLPLTSAEILEIDRGR